MSDIIIRQVVEQLRALPEHLQREVLAFVQQASRSLAGATEQAVAESSGLYAPPTLVGTPGKLLLSFAGTIPPDDLEQMRQAIDADCAG